MKHVLIVGDKDPEEEWLPYARAFVKKGWRVTMLFFYRNPVNTGKRTIQEGIESISMAIPPENIYIDKSVVRQIEALPDGVSVPRFLFTEVYLYYRSYEEVLAEACGMWKQLQFLFETANFTLVLQNQGGGTLRRLAFVHARTRKTPCIFFDVSWFPGRMFLSSDETAAVKEYKPLSRAEISPELITKMQEFREQQIHSKPEYTYVFPVEYNIPRPSLIQKLMHKDIKKSFAYRWRRIGKWLRSRVSKFVFDALNNEAIPPSSFFFFPLHYPMDSQLTLRAMEFMRQEFLVEFIHWNLPHGTKLVIKPHPQAGGDYSVQMMKTMKKLPNVALLPVHVSSHDVLSSTHCLGTIVINSSVGFESLLYYRPVIALGLFYGLYYDGIIIPTVLKKLAENLHRIKTQQVQKDDFLCVLASIYKATYVAQAYSAHIDYERVVSAVIQKKEYDET